MRDGLYITNYTIIGVEFQFVLWIKKITGAFSDPVIFVVILLELYSRNTDLVLH